MLRSLLVLVFVCSLMLAVTGAFATSLLWYMGDVRPDAENSCGPGIKWSQWHGEGTVVDEGSLVDDLDAYDGKAWYIHDTSTAKDAWRTGNDEIAGTIGATIIARVKVIGETSAGGNIGILENGGQSAQYHWGGPSGHIKETARGDEVWVTDVNDDRYHIIRLTTIGTSQSTRIIRLYIDEEATPRLEITNALHCGGTGVDAFMFGSTGTGGTQDIYFDWITGSNAGCFAPGEEVAVLGKSLVPVRPVGRTIDECKTLRDGALAELAGMVVTTPTYGINESNEPAPSGFVIEKGDRSAGIRVAWNSWFLFPGDIVDITGTVGTLNGERIISASTVDTKSSGNEIPDPLCLSNRSSGGGTYGQQQAVVDDASQSPPKMSAGMNTVGILMKLTGKVTAEKTDSSFLENYVYIDDGSGLNDGSGHIGIRCSPSTEPGESKWNTLPPMGSQVAMTGVMEVKQINGINARYFLCVSWTIIPN